MAASSLFACPALAIIVTPQPSITVDPLPVGVAFNPAGTLAYVASTSGNNLTVIDTATGTVQTPITVCSGTTNGPIGVAIKSASKGIAACYNDHTVVEFNPTTGAIIATLAVGVAPFFVALSPDGSLAYVPNSGSATVSVIDTTTDLVTHTIAVGSGPVAVAFNPSGTRAYVANSTVGGTGNTVSVINVATSAVIATIAVTGVPYGVAVSPDGASLYVSRNNGLKVSIISTATNAITTTFTTVGKPEGVTFSPDGKRVYVPMLTGGTAVFDATTLTQLTPLASGSLSRLLAFNPAGTLAYVTNNGDSNVSVFAFDNAQPTIAGTPPAATEGTAYSFTPTVTGTNAVVTLFSGTLPPGLTLASGVVSGTPTAGGPYSFTLRVTNANGTADLATSITVAVPVPPTITGASTADAPLDAVFSWSPTIVAAPGYVVTSSALPSGLLLASATGDITGTPTGPLGPTLVTITVTDAVGTDTFDVTITVTHGVAASLTSTPSDATPNVGDTITVTVIAQDAHGNDWDVSSASTITSSVASDAISGNSVTFTHASPHLLTAAFGALTTSSLVQVTGSAASGGLSATGVDRPWWIVALAPGLLMAGLVLVVATGRRRRRA